MAGKLLQKSGSFHFLFSFVSAVIFKQNADFYTENKQTGQLIFLVLVTLTKKRKMK